MVHFEYPPFDARLHEFLYRIIDLFRNWQTWICSIWLWNCANNGLRWCRHRFLLSFCSIVSNWCILGSIPICSQVRCPLLQKEAGKTNARTTKSNPEPDNWSWTCIYICAHYQVPKRVEGVTEEIGATAPLVNIAADEADLSDSDESIPGASYSVSFLLNLLSYMMSHALVSKICASFKGAK